MNNFKLTSASFEHNSIIPTIYTCDGKGISPSLSWENAPKETKSFVLIMEGPDAPKNTWYHWILFNISSYVEKLPEGVQQLPDDTKGEKIVGANQTMELLALQKKNIVIFLIYIRLTAFYL